MMTAISSIPSFSAVADTQYFARLVEPVFSPVTVKGLVILSSLFVFDKVNSLLPARVTCVIFSIHIVEYALICGYFVISSRLIRATSSAVV